MARPVKFSDVGRGVAPEMRAKAERLVELREAHMAAIRGGDQSFYSDGRHEELVGLLPDVYSALGIRPWEDATAILGAALNAAEK